MIITIFTEYDELFRNSLELRCIKYTKLATISSNQIDLFEDLEVRDFFSRLYLDKNNEDEIKKENDIVRIFFRNVKHSPYIENDEIKYQVGLKLTELFSDEELLKYYILNKKETFCSVENLKDELNKNISLKKINYQFNYMLFYFLIMFVNPFIMGLIYKFAFCETDYAIFVLYLSGLIACFLPPPSMFCSDWNKELSITKLLGDIYSPKFLFITILNIVLFGFIL